MSGVRRRTSAIGRSAAAGKRPGKSATTSTSTASTGNKDELRWYVDGVLVHKLKNTNWQFPMRIVFDSEPMLQWFGKINDADLPSTFDVQYLRVWRQQTP